MAGRAKKVPSLASLSRTRHAKTSGSVGVIKQSRHGGRSKSKADSALAGMSPARFHRKFFPKKKG